MAIETLRPNAVGTYTNIQAQTPDSGDHYDKVDEETPDETDTTVQSLWSGYSGDTYNIPDHSQGSGTINNVRIYCRCKAGQTPDQASLQVYCRTHSTNYGSDEEQTLTTDWANYYRQWDTNPYTGEAWTWDEIDALEIGLRLRTPQNGNSVWSYCTQVWVEVDYTPPAIEKSSSDAGTGTEAGGLLKDLLATELGRGSDSLTAKIEMPTKGGGMKLWT